MNGNAIGMDTNGDDPMAAMLENNALTKVILFYWVGGQPSARLFWEGRAHENKGRWWRWSVTHIGGKLLVAVCWLVCFAFLCWVAVASFLARRECRYWCSYCAAVVLFGSSCFGVFWDYDWEVGLTRLAGLLICCGPLQTQLFMNPFICLFN